MAKQGPPDTFNMHVYICFLCPWWHELFAEICCV